MNSSFLSVCALVALWAVVLFCCPAKAAVIFYSEDFSSAAVGGLVRIDFDRDQIDDLLIDVSWQTRADNDGAFVASPLGDARIAALAGISQSFSVGEIVRLEELNLLGSPDTVLTGGIISDAFGNPLWEGWGGCSSDSFGNVSCPDGGPTHQIDLFLMELGDGVAWVDLNPSGIGGFGDFDVDWGFLPSAGSSFTITQVPEPGSAVLPFIAVLFVLHRRRR